MLKHKKIIKQHMKKILIIFIIVILNVNLYGCDNSKAFKTAKSAYDNINTAYEMVNTFSSDIYEIWRAGIYEKNELTKNCLDYFSQNLSTSEEDIINGIVETMCDHISEPLSRYKRSVLKDSAYLFFNVFTEDVPNNCLRIIENTYEINGTIEKIQESLDAAKIELTTLNEKHSGYKHYPELEKFYSSTNAFFEFCQDPSSSFEQAKVTINDYKNDIRNSISTLDLYFKDETNS